MRRVVLAAVVAALGAASSDGDGAPPARVKVAKLSVDTYEAFLADAGAKERWVLLDFYAPWCGHCKRLNPVLDAFAAETPGAAVAKIDATAETALAKAHGVDGYPTLRFSSDAAAGTFRDYKGPRTGEGLALLAARLGGPEISALADGGAALERLAAPPPGVAFVASLPVAPELEAAFDAVARRSFHTASFGKVFGGEGLERGAIQVAAPGAWPLAFDPADDYEKALASFVKKHNFPLFNALGPANFRKLGDRRLVVAAVVDPADAAEAAGCEAVARGASKIEDPAIRDRFAFGALDGARWREYVATFGFYKSDLPRILVMDLKNDLFYDGFEPPPENAAEALIAYLGDVAADLETPRYLGWRGFPDRAAAFWLQHSTEITCGLGVLALALFAATGLFADDAGDAGDAGGREKRD